MDFDSPAAAWNLPNGSPYRLLSHSGGRYFGGAAATAGTLPGSRSARRHDRARSRSEGSTIVESRLYHGKSIPRAVLTATNGKKKEHDGPSLSLAEDEEARQRSAREERPAR